MVYTIKNSCELGCKEFCKAKQHGCASECPALPWQPNQVEKPKGPPLVVLKFNNLSKLETN